MRIIELRKGDLTLRDKITGFLEREVTAFGNSAKVDCPKKFIGRRVYLLIADNESRRRGKATPRRK